MSMVTRCPACATLFRVTAQQLQAREGRVRCGRCATVFDGFRDLATLPEQPPREPQRAGAGDSAGASQASRRPAAEARDAPSAPHPTMPAVPQTPPVPAGFRFAPPSASEAIASARAIASPSARPESRRERALTAPQPIGADAHFLQQAQAARRRGWRGWALGSAFLVVTLAAQGAYFYRGELATRYRPLKPLLAGVCEALRCEVPLPQRPGLINIEASDLQSLDPARPGVIELTATLRNHADYDVAYPALDLVLTNTREHMLARRVFLPHEYLDPSRAVSAGFPAKAEITIRLDLDTGELGAAGFRLDLLPAPAR